MIDGDSIKLFFDLEAEASKKNWDDLMRLPVKERVRKRKAIQNVFIDSDFSKLDSGQNILMRVTAKQNLSDIKEGDYLLLHKEGTTTGIKCWLHEFDGDEGIVLGVSNYNYSVNSLEVEKNLYQGVPLVLDRDYVDLRDNVFNNFVFGLSEDPLFWENHLINCHKAPIFDNPEPYLKSIKETIDSFSLSFTEKQKEAILKSLSAKDYYLIQGPPGTGKSHVLAWIILQELCDYNHKVIVIGPNHLTINNMLVKICESFSAYNFTLKIGQSYNAPKKLFKVDDDEKPILNIERVNVPALCDMNLWVIGLTPYCLYTSRARGITCDTLVIDEAGQMTIPLALMGMMSAKKVIMAGDHKQLPPIISSEEIHNDLMQSVFQRLITDDNYTMLDISFRMCGPICNFVSEVFYEGKIHAMNEECSRRILCEDVLYSFDSPVVIHNVDDNGEQTSDKEADFIVDVIQNYLQKGLSTNEIAVLSPFRAQAANIRRRIMKHITTILEEDCKQIAVDTIDKMQGQEREVIIVTLVAGNLAYMTEMADFLYNPNKLNVAFSRAKSKLIIVGNIENIRKMNLDDYPHIPRILESGWVKFV